jgi:hypothetical protein
MERPIVTGRKPRVKPTSGERTAGNQTAKKWGRPVRRPKRRQSHGSAFNHAEENHDIANPLKGLKKSPAQPRLHSLSKEEEQSVAGNRPLKDHPDDFRESLLAKDNTVEHADTLHARIRNIFDGCNFTF